MEDVKDEVSRELTAHPQANLPMLTERFQPRNLTELMSWAKLVVSSKLAPKDMNQAGVVICVQMAAELRISPAQALQNIALINGRPSIFGDLGLALFRRDAKFKSFTERSPSDALGSDEGYCRIEMKDGTTVERTFSIEEAKTAKLWQKAGPWTTYPGRMLMFRARWWAMRDAAPEVFKGLSSREEQQDLVEAEYQVREEPKRKSDTSAGGVDTSEVDAFVQDTVEGKKTEPSRTPAGRKPAAAAPAAKQDGGEFWQGPIIDIRSKPTAQKKPRWFFYSPEEEEFHTFDEKVFDFVKANGKGSVVRFRYETHERWGRKVLEAMAPIEEPTEPTEPAASEDLFNEK